MAQRYLQDHRFQSREDAKAAMEVAAECHPEDVIVLQDGEGLELERLGPLDSPKGQQ